MLPRLVATDLDGTLLRGDSTLSPRTVDALRAARAAGLRVVLATARPARVVAQLFADLDVLDAAVCGNGAVRYDPATRELLLTHPLAPPVTTRVIAEVDRLVSGACYAAETGHRVLHEPGYHYRPTFDSQRYPVADRSELCAQPLVKLMALLPHRDPDAAWALLRPSLGWVVSCTWSGGGGSHEGYPAILEIAAPGVGKAAALAALCTQWGIDAADTVAFGDAPNDLDMLAWAGTGYAVANAHPDVLAATPHRVPGNDSDGVAQLLESLLS